MFLSVSFCSSSSVLNFSSSEIFLSFSKALILSLPSPLISDAHLLRISKSEYRSLMVRVRPIQLLSIQLARILCQPWQFKTCRWMMEQAPQTEERLMRASQSTVPFPTLDCPHITPSARQSISRLYRETCQAVHGQCLATSRARDSSPSRPGR